MKLTKKTISLLLSVLMVLGAVSAGGMSVSADGDGIVYNQEKSRYEISNYEGLKAFAALVNGNEDEEIAPNPSANAVLTQDIFATYNPVWDPEGDEIEYAKDWVPIANSGDRPFTGAFDGDGYTITGLDNSEADSDDKSDSGLFGFIGEGGSVKNVRLESANLEGSNIGGIAHENNGTIQNCSFDGSIGGGYGSGGTAGGIACDNYGTITDCCNNGSVSGDGPVGGIAGKNDGTITNCYNTGGITGIINGYGSNEAGGIAGDNVGTVANCYNKGNVTGNKCVGGVLGSNYNNGTLTDCCNTGNVTGNKRVGGIAGYMSKNNPSWVCSVTNCYSAGSVTLSGENAGYAGGVVGYNDSNCTVENCYYDSGKCTFGAIDGADNAENSVTGLTTDKMTGENALDNMPGLSSDSWLVRANDENYSYYPHLKGFAYDTDPTDANWPAKTEYTAPAVVYEISNYAELVAFAALVNGNEDEEIAPEPSANAVLTADIECKYNEFDFEYAKDWEPIANSGGRPFTGAFDGSGYKITGLDNSEADNKNDSGLFGFIGESGSVKNVRLESANLEGSNIGGIAHKNNGTIQDCSFDGSIGGGYGSGGAAGGIACNNHGAITNCYNTGSVSGDGPVGGIAGDNNGTITNCYNTGGITGNINGYGRTGAGGITGSNNGTVANCYNTGDVTGDSGVGGIIGGNYNVGTLTDCYNTGSVTGHRAVGGIAGYMNKNNPSWTCSVTNCYSAGSVTLSGEDAGYAGGVVGYNDSNCTVENCYYDSGKCTFGAIAGADNAENSVKGLTTDKMTGETALDNMPGLSSDSWLTKANADGWAYYPHLRGFAYDTDPTDTNWPAKTEQTKADPGITLTVTPEEPVLGDDFIITATLPENATGTVTLAIEDKELTAPVDGDGTATFTIPGLVPGEHDVSVSYSGDDSYNAVTEELTVKIPKYSFTVTLEISTEEPVYGDDVTITANLPENATGRIILTVDGIDYTVPVTDGKAVFTVESPDPGEHTVTATYPGDDEYNEASASEAFTVQAAVIAPTGVSLDKHEINFTEGDSQTLTATIAPAGATGTITWYSNNPSVAEVSGNNDGTATVSAAGVGTATITATIEGTEFSDTCTVNVNHDWGAPTYTWSGDNSTCTATRVCTRNASHKEEETATAAVTTTATCTEAGTATYTATFANAGFEVQGKEVAVDALGHDWQDIVLQQATGDALGIMGKKCSRCGDIGETHLYAEEGTSPSKYPDGTNISEGDTMQADSSQKLGDTDVMVIVQDPLYAAELYSVVIESISEDLGNDYDGAYTAENAYKANVIIINDSGVQISGQLRGKVRLLLEIPDGWDVNEVQVLRLTEGNDIEFAKGIEYQLYDAQGNFIKVVDKDYQPAEGETVKAFAVVWTDHFSPYALVDPLENTDKEYDIKFVNEDGTELQSTKVLYGETPEYKGETPVKAATDKATYTFKGWSPEIVPVTGDATYTATFTETKKDKPADDKPAAKAAIAIKGEDALTLGYKQNKTFTADTEGVPEGGKVQWYLNGEKAGEGKTFKVENPEDDYTVQSKIVDKDGSTVAESETVKVTVKHGFFDKLKAWFTDLILGVFAPLFSKFEEVC